MRIRTWRITQPRNGGSKVCAPDRVAIEAFATSIESQIDGAYFAHVNPGQVTLHRLNRAEYHNAAGEPLAHRRYNRGVFHA